MMNIGGQTVVKKKPKNVVAVMPGRLKPYFYAVLGGGTGPELVQQGVEALQVIRDGEYIRQGDALGAENEAVVLILGHINSNANHSKTSNGKFVMLFPQNTLLL